MKIVPVLSEKSLKNLKAGFYSFWVPKAAKKPQIKKEIADLFGVHVKSVRTANYKKLPRPKKRALVTLSKGEKIDIFEKAKK